MKEFDSWYLDLWLHGDEAVAVIGARDLIFTERDDINLLMMARLTKQV
jgi:hypothetical protein